MEEEVKEVETAQEPLAPEKSRKKKKLTVSHILACWMLALTTGVSAATILLMYLCVKTGYTGALYALSALITLCQAGNAIVLSGYFQKSKAENTQGGITYDTAMLDAAAEFTDVPRDA